MSKRLLSTVRMFTTDFSKMSAHTIASLERISREKLAEMVRAEDPELAIIDVRDSDYIGGHILGCQNVPTNTHDYKMPELVRTLREKDTVVFHCALSQQRGPSSALKYLREKERLSDGDSSSQQKVYVLDGGFQKWQEKYGKDTKLTEGYVKDLWEEY
ncbi:CDC25-like phosphatase [Fulvia fulva]|uniref:CDC25-like phosphatase n=1 Tax=Passalora fulva TaxID=5499 RepID=A0A9Q8P6D4_PASFU|nr:CDC25-like phosphatase [Fulvia fulva]KAK4629431.1 CDC25-like phosphatase [Fulvia fulva]KAK4630621.1 CDC25-like phosphatase [Fulvia fulva]UJO14923.1 CDC25-like phosphatase [Fulvia fulva]WPV12371.1 CDC25-like phosphatase [Fulvia fulva]WPV27167.1 CDC25-like phosphatase [Fulvia fulva]